MVTPTIRVFKASPDRGRGLARDLPVRWAFEEVGQRYDVHPVSFKEMKERTIAPGSRSARSRPMRRTA